MKYLIVLTFLVTVTFGYPSIQINSADFYDDAEEKSGNFEGDMILSSEQLSILNGVTPKNGLIDVKYRWKNNIVPYEITLSHFTVEQRAHIRKGLDELQRVSCLTFKERNGETDYISVTGSSGGCFSSVGRRGGKQTLNLEVNQIGSGCFRLGTIMHEFIHALGFYHMQSASTRDKYVEIVWDNISSGTEHNFNKYDANVVTEFGTIYDYSSVMHYSAYAFSKNGEKTIVSFDSSANIGQREGLSQKDIIKIKAMYC